MADWDLVHSERIMAHRGFYDFSIQNRHSSGIDRDDDIYEWLLRAEPVWVSAELTNVIMAAAMTMPEDEREITLSGEVFTPVGWAMFGGPPIIEYEPDTHNYDKYPVPFPQPRRKVLNWALGWEYQDDDFYHVTLYLKLESVAEDYHPDRMIAPKPVEWVSGAETEIGDYASRVAREDDLHVTDDGHVIYEWVPPSERQARDEEKGRVPLDSKEAIQLTNRIFTAMMIISQQKIVSSDRGRLGRSERRRIERSGGTIGDIVTFVLRRTQKRMTEEEAKHRGYSHRFIVHGHWRKQPFGTLRDKWHWTWIHDYVKGDPDKPLIIKERRWDFRR